jgi:hypothetical protein
LECIEAKTDLAIWFSEWAFITKLRMVDTDDRYEDLYDAVHILKKLINMYEPRSPWKHPRFPVTPRAPSSRVFSSQTGFRTVQLLPLLDLVQQGNTREARAQARMANTNGGDLSGSGA